MANAQAKIFKEGDRVKWTSQAGGNHTTKRGEVVSVVQPKEIPQFGPLARRFDAASNYGGGMMRGHVSYVVLVRPSKGKAKPRLYWPVASLLKAVEATEIKEVA